MMVSMNLVSVKDLAAVQPRRLRQSIFSIKTVLGCSSCIKGWMPLSIAVSFNNILATGEFQMNCWFGKCCWSANKTKATIQCSTKALCANSVVIQKINVSYISGVHTRASTEQDIAIIVMSHRRVRCNL